MLETEPTILLPFTKENSVSDTLCIIHQFLEFLLFRTANVV